MSDECIVFVAFFMCIVGCVFAVGKCEESSTRQQKEFLLTCVQTKTAEECGSLSTRLR